MTWIRHEYSRRQAFNSDNSRFLTWSNNGGWHLYNASTLAWIKALSGPGGDAEPNWFVNDPTKLYYILQYGLVIKTYDIDDDSVATVVNFAGRLPWGDAAYISTGAEGSPSANGRYWAFIATTSSFACRGIFTYDMQLDQIIATVSVSGSCPGDATMTPTGDYAIFTFVPENVYDGNQGRARAYTRDLTDWTWVGCGGSHSDTALLANGHDAYLTVDWSTYGGDPAYCFSDGYVNFKDIQSGFVSHGYATGRIPVMATYGYGGAQAYDAGVHISGRALDRPGVALISTYLCVGSDYQEDGPGCPTAISNRTVLAHLSATPTLDLLARTHGKYGSMYFNETQATINRNGTRALFASNYRQNGTAAEVPDSYIVELPSATFTITTTTMPNGTNGQAYQADAQTTGGTQPPTACITSAGALPTGASWSVSGNACRLSDASIETGTYNFTLQATDSNSNTDTQAFTLTVNASLQIDTASPMPGGTVGSGYSEQLVCSGGTPPRTFSCCQAGSLPTGLSLASNGTFTGAFQQTGVFNFTARCTDNIPANADKALQITVTGGAVLSMRQPTIMVGHNYAAFTIGAPGLEQTADCQAVVKDNGGATVDTITSTSGPAIRKLVTSVALTASSAYSATFTCAGANPDLTPYPFVTLATPSGGNRTVPLQFGTPTITAARLTVEYDDNEALSSPATEQNTSCGSGCTVNLSLAAGLWYYRHKWQTAADVVLATSAVQPLQVQ